MSIGLRLLLVLGLVSGIYGAGFMTAARLFYARAEITRLEAKAATATAAAEDANETVRRHSAAASDATARTAVLEAATATLQQRIDSYEQQLTRPDRGAGDFRLGPDDARRLRDIASAACDRAAKAGGTTAAGARLAGACAAPDYAEGDDARVLAGRLLGRLIEANGRLVNGRAWYQQLNEERARK